jgi:hypothetical protein
MSATTPGAFALGLLLLATPVAAQELGVVEVVLAPGGTYAMCESGEIICPAHGPICDDASVATSELDPKRGLLWVATGNGTTLCSAGVMGANGGGPRRVFRITVKARPRAPAPKR